MQLNGVIDSCLRSARSRRSQLLQIFLDGGTVDREKQYRSFLDFGLRFVSAVDAWPAGRPREPLGILGIQAFFQPYLTETAGGNEGSAGALGSLYAIFFRTRGGETTDGNRASGTATACA